MVRKTDDVGGRNRNMREPDRNKKKRNIIRIAAAAGGFLLAIGGLGMSGCGKAEENAAQVNTVKENAAGEYAVQESISGEDTGMQNETRTPGEAGSEGEGLPSDAASGGEFTELEEAQLAKLQEFLSSNANCLTCSYEKPEDINVMDIFYSLLSQGEEVSAEEAAALGWEEKLDAAKFPVTMMNAFLTDKFGITLDQVKEEITMQYLPGEDAYYLNVGDTNLIMPECLSGSGNGDMVKIIYRAWDYEEGYWEVTLRKTAEGWQFFSNVKLSAGEE